MGQFMVSSDFGGSSVMEILKAKVAEILHNNGYEPAEIDYDIKFFQEPNLISFRVNYWEQLEAKAWMELSGLENVVIEQFMVEDEDCLPEYFYEVKYK